MMRKQTFCLVSGMQLGTFVLICTSAFGMGIYCKGVEQVYHWGPLDDIELYVQEIGQAGRDDRQCTTTLFVSDTETKGDFDHYCYSQECRCLTLERLFQVDKLLVMPACFCCGSCEQV